MRFVVSLAFFVLVVTSACSKVTVGPFVPPHAKVCSKESDCSKNYTCRFPAVDTKSVCMPGENKLDQQPTF